MTKVERFFTDGCMMETGAFEADSHVEMVNLVAKVGKLPFE